MTALNSHHHQGWSRYFGIWNGFWVLCLPPHPYPFTLSLRGTKQSLGAKTQTEHVLSRWPPKVQTVPVISADGPYKGTLLVAVIRQTDLTCRASPLHWTILMLVSSCHSILSGLKISCTGTSRISGLSKEALNITVPEIPSQGLEKHEQLSEANHQDTDAKPAI